MRFCPDCGAAVTQRIPDGDHRPRFVCTDCEIIHYHNPKIVSGCIPEWDGQIMLARRGIEPRAGLWTLPAGFMENGESTDDAAARETIEETCANVEILELYALFSIPHINQVYMFYRARMLSPEFSLTPESTEIAFYDPDKVPWSELAFPVVEKTLECYAKDALKGEFKLHTGSIHIHPSRKR